MTLTEARSPTATTAIRVVVNTHFATMQDPRVQSVYEQFMSNVVKSLYGPEAVAVFGKNRPGDDGANTIYIGKPMDEGTSNDIVKSLFAVFKQQFVISYGDSSSALNKAAEIRGLTAQFKLRYEP